MMNRGYLNSTSLYRQPEAGSFFVRHAMRARRHRQETPAVAADPYETLRILSLTLFEPTPLEQQLAWAATDRGPCDVFMQMSLFE